jgi:hypothetical protein
VRWAGTFGHSVDRPVPRAFRIFHDQHPADYPVGTVAALSLARLNSRPVTLAGLVLFVAGLAFMVAGMSAAENRGQVVSTYFVFAYSGLIVPVIGVGVAADYVGNLRAVLGCSIVLAVLCAVSAAIIIEPAVLPGAASLRVLQLPSTAGYRRMQRRQSDFRQYSPLAADAHQTWGCAEPRVSATLAAVADTR